MAKKVTKKDGKPVLTDYMKFVTKSNSNATISHLTTFLPIDYLNGAIEDTTILDKDTLQPTGDVLRTTALGIVQGSINMFVGDPGTGKSAAALLFGAGIVMPHRFSKLYYWDIEGGMPLTRVKKYTGWNDDIVFHKFELYDRGIYAERFLSEVADLCEQKMELVEDEPEKYTYNTGVFNAFRQPIYRPIPDVIVMDSLGALSSKDIFELNEMQGETAQMRQARHNNGLFRQLNQKVAEANVIVFIVGHKNPRPQLGMVPQKAINNNLSNDITISGGKFSQYISNNGFDFVAAPKPKEDKLEFGVDGFNVDVKIWKSRTAASGRSVKMFLNQDTGFDRLISMYQFLSEKGAITASGAYNKLENDVRGDFKFTKKNMKDIYKKSMEFRRLWYEIMIFHGYELIAKPNDVNEMNIDPTSLALMNAYN